MSATRSLIFRILTILALLYSMGMGLFYFRSIMNVYSQGRVDYVVKWESLMADVKKEIPADEKVIGYVSEWDRLGFDKDVYIEFVLTQYAFAPQLVRRDLNHEWIIANSTDPGFLGWLTSQLTSSFTVQELGSGIYIIHRGDL
ncbi:MAG: hypothetical protein HZB19_06475 [Chloroflexi bacterium]|nr:hypothetical protein [Chloroflexota bacterium]